MTRLAVPDADRYKLKECAKACDSFCPIVPSRVDAIKIEGNKAVISEMLAAAFAYAPKSVRSKPSAL